jgi:hypothetical protein
MLLEASLRKLGIYSIQHCDPLEPPVSADCILHLEQPIRVWMSWGRTNVLVVNPEWYVPASYNAYLSHFDKVIFKNESARSHFVKTLGVDKLPLEKTAVLPWATPAWKVEGVKTSEQNDPRLGFGCFLGGSKNRHEFMKTFLPFWRESYPQLNIFSVGGYDLNIPTQDNIKYRVDDLTEEQRYRLATFFPGHVVCSSSEGYSYTAGEAEEVGAFAIHNTIQAFESTYGSSTTGVGWFPTVDELTNPKYSLALFASSKVSNPALAQTALDTVIRNFLQSSIAEVREARKLEAAKRRDLFDDMLKSLVSEIPALLTPQTKDAAARPPILMPENCPPISIVTLLYNRARFFDLACHNIMISDYPKEKIQWIIVDDTDDVAENIRDKIMNVKEKSEPLKIDYIPLDTHVSVSTKRNLGCKAATADIVLMMDDDDHYPETSFRRRVAWLTLHPWKPKAVGCSTIACYDLVKAISAVNVPPLDLPLSQRMSEATLTFYKSWWEEGGFASDVQVGEGEMFLRGREEDVLELPPQQIIVAFSHGKNTSSRLIPGGDDVKPGCFWGFPKEFLVYIHALAGMKVQEG